MNEKIKKEHLDKAKAKFAGTGVFPIDKKEVMDLMLTVNNICLSDEDANEILDAWYFEKPIELPEPEATAIEIAEADGKVTEAELAKMNTKQLKEYADKVGIAVTKKSKADIFAEIKAAK